MAKTLNEGRIAQDSITRPTRPFKPTRPTRPTNPGENTKTQDETQMNLSVGSTKTLLHNAAMVDRFIAMSGKSPNMRLNNTDFNELLFYGVRAAV